MTHSPLRVELPTGVLSVKTYSSVLPLEDLCAFAARNNRKRGFLCVSKVLGKHWPVTPGFMQHIHRYLAARIRPECLPMVFVGMAETATGLGQGVFEAFLATNPVAEALFLHTTRYRIPQRAFLSFEERHTHAPDFFLYHPLDSGQEQLFRTASSLVLIDDEISTGSTLCNLVLAYRRCNPRLERLMFVCITDFAGPAIAARYGAELGLPVQTISLLSGALRFEPGPSWPDETAPPAVGRTALSTRMLGEHLGRFGIRSALELAERDMTGLANELRPGARVLVLGTGEFMHLAFRVGLALETMGFKVSVQATTRSPILAGAGISWKIAFPDNYGEGIGNYLYNVNAADYEGFVICHETPFGEGLHELSRQLGNCVYYYRGDPRCGSN